MIEIVNEIQSSVSEALKSLYDLDFKTNDIIVNHTKKEFEGEYTVVVFPFVKLLRKSPEDIANELAQKLIRISNDIVDYSVVKGFLNLSLTSGFWLQQLDAIIKDSEFGRQPRKNETILVEYSSPNTNKPLHLGHIRNILLGWSCSKLLDAIGYDVVKTQVVNDRGIAICKSMLAWKKYGEGKTPDSSGIKGDHFVGEFYVRFEQEFLKEYKEWQKTDEAKEIYRIKSTDKEISEVHFFKKFRNAYFNEYSSLGAETKNMLIQWESEDLSTIELWKEMNRWVYAGFKDTYRDLGVDFDYNYYESKTYTLGKKIIEEGIESGNFFRKADRSVWVNLEDAGLDEKILLRSDGTSVYLTQDLGTAELRYNNHHPVKMIYVVGDEQDYHFQVLFEVLKKLKKQYANGLHHLSYGMVDLPEGKMKSREGTVVDADDLIAEVLEEANISASERGELTDLNIADQGKIIKQIAMAALKFFMIKVQAKKRMVFNPKEAVDMQGQTGPYIQNAYVRIQSILRKQREFFNNLEDYELFHEEKLLVRELLLYPSVVQQAADDLDPSGLANYCYGLAKSFHKFYHDFRILNAESKQAKNFRISLSKCIALVLEKGSSLLGIEMPDRM